MLDTLTAPTAEPLHLLDALAHIKQDAGIDDGHITASISAARVVAENRTWRTMVATRYRQVFDGFPGVGQSGIEWGNAYARPTNTIYLDRCPVKAVESIQYLAMDGTTQTVPPASYTVDYSAQPCRITPIFGTIWPIPMPQIGAVTVVFVAGYCTSATFNQGAGTMALGAWQTLAVGDVVRLSNSGGALPLPLSAATDYYIQSVVSFGVYKLTATPGGAAIVLTTAGTGLQFVGEIPADLMSWMRLRVGSIDLFREEVAMVSRGKIEILPFVDGLLDAYATW